ncbi:MAG TPA: WG repeat-containing protein [Pyrinomonadaceae bacterium]
MKARLPAIVLIVQIIFCQPVSAQQRGGGLRVASTGEDGSRQEVKLYDGSYALVIGNSEYALGWERLSGVKSDIVAVRDVLERHGFKVEVEENLTSEQLSRRVRTFINDYGYDRDNRLLVYYAGHGSTLGSAGDKREVGYIIPSDTPLPTRDQHGFRQKAVSMYAIQNFAREIQAKHALFIFDSCFSGRLFALRDKPKITPFVLEKVSYPVRQFITAGDETQTVPDESVFRKAFVRGLEGDANRNNDAYITGTELADYLKESVTNYTKRRLTPQYGTINDIDLDRGDIVFAVPGTPAFNAASQPAAVPPADALTVERAYWEEIKNSTDVGDFRLYQKNYPNGIFSKLADLKITRLTRAAAQPSATPNRASASPPVTRRVPATAIDLEKFEGANGKYGYKDKSNGRIIIEPKYDAAYPFYDGLANVKLNGKEGYIDQHGEAVFPLKYDSVEVRFSYGLSRVRLGTKYGFIDKTGKVVVPIMYDSAGSYANGLAWVKLGVKYGYLDTTNKLVIPLKYDAASSFSNGKAKVKLYGKAAFIDKTGGVVFPFKYEELGSFSEGLLGAKFNGKWGYVDESDKMIVPFKYDNVWSFYRGLANVLLGGKQGYIDKTGKVVVPLIYDNVSIYFYEEMAWVKLNKKYGYVHKTGRLAISIKYDDANDFSGGKAKVKLGARVFYIDKEGNEVTPP